MRPFCKSDSVVHLSPYTALPLTLKNVFEAVKRVRKNWRKLGNKLLFYDKVDAIERQHDSDEARLKAVIEAFLLGEGIYEQPSWRRVIHALHQAGESQVAHDIESYAEAVKGECECVIMCVPSWRSDNRLHVPILMCVCCGMHVP